MKKYKTQLLGVPEETIARELGDKYGYGAMMRAFEAVWSDKDDRGAFVVGTCVAMVTPCECEHSNTCDWCAGAGWLTHHVKELKNKSELKELDITIKDEWIDGLAKLKQLDGSVFKLVPDLDTPANNEAIEKRRKWLFGE